MTGTRSMAFASSWTRTKVLIVIFLFLGILGLSHYRASTVALFQRDARQSPIFSKFSMGQFPFFKTSKQSSQDARKMMLAGVAPWNIPEADNFRYQQNGLESELSELLKVQADENKRVTVMVFNEAVTDLMRNNIYSLNAMGGVASYIVVALDKSSLQKCQKMNLPCFDGNTIIGQGLDTQGQEQLPDSPHYSALTWFKPRIMYEVLRLGYDVHFTDTDVAYYGNVYEFWEKQFTGGALFAGMRQTESPSNAFNGGQLFIASHPRTINLFSRWLSLPREGKGDGYAFDEYLLTNATWLQRCKAGHTCYQIMTDSSTAVPFRVFGGRLDLEEDDKTRWDCPLNSTNALPLCDRTEPYVHLACHGKEKRDALKAMGLWFLTTCDGPSGNGRKVTEPTCIEKPLQIVDPRIRPASDIPCKHGAWVDGRMELLREKIVEEKGYFQ